MQQQVDSAGFSNKVTEAASATINSTSIAAALITHNSEGSGFGEQSVNQSNQKRENKKILDILIGKKACCQLK